MIKTKFFFVLFIAVAICGALFIARTIIAQSKVSGAAKNYLDVTSRDFDPTKAGKPNPKKKQTPPPCCNHPYYHSVWRAFSKNGVSSWQTESKKFIDHASVPDVLIKDDGTQIVYYVDGNYDTMNCKIVKNSKKSPGKCRIYNFSGKKAWDPEVVKVDDYYRMYFMSPPQMPGVAGNEMGSKIKTAVSRDGIKWLEESTTALKGDLYIDPTVIEIGSWWKMIVISDTKGMMQAESSNGKTFKLKGKVKGSCQDGKSPHLTKLANKSRTLQDSLTAHKKDLFYSHSFLQATGYSSKVRDKYALYYCKNGISVSFSKNGKSWSGEKVVLPQQTMETIICDPSVEKQEDGKYVMYYKKQIMSQQQI